MLHHAASMQHFDMSDAASPRDYTSLMLHRSSTIKALRNDANMRAARMLHMLSTYCHDLQHHVS